MNFNPLLLEAAGQYIGEAEWPGAKSNPVISGFFAASGNSEVTSDEVPWCAAFVGAVLAQIGLQGTGKLNARSYADWGAAIPLKDAMPGDIVVFWRESPRSWKGHVAFLVRFDGADRVVVRGGNQRNRVADETYSVGQILCVRRAVQSGPGARPVLQIGSKNAFVYELQDRLARLGYAVGNRDGVYGVEVRRAVLAFQADQEIEVDGVVGGETWGKLKTATPKPMRSVSAADLRQRGSTIVKNADTIDVVAGVTTATATISTVASSAQQAEGALAVVTRIVTDHWPTLILVGALVTVIVLTGRIRKARVEDAQSGAHMGR